MSMDMKYKEILSSLPKRETSTQFSYVDHYQYKGFWFPLAFLESTLSMQENFKAQPSNIFLCGLPKTGTTWLKALIFSIMSRHHYDESTNPLLTKVPHECIPTFEVDCDINFTSLDDAKFQLLGTHLPYSCLPQSILEAKCKIIYLCREPKDTFVSTWHYRQRLQQTNPELDNNLLTLEQEFKWFIEGKSAYGPYWDHVSEYKKASKDRPLDVLFIRYEDLKGDTLCYVKKLAEFMGTPFSKEEEDQFVAEKIVASCDFGNLSNLEVNKSGFVNPKPWLKINNNAFFRKGEIGDWKNLLTEDMAKQIDNIVKEKLIQ
ncbi:putative deacetylvindoline O-acetyltransferase-like [Capsicum annuum]|uniref:flavonol sulfotransferase-like n=1 Tax=Capsicum annuum TaxID=4072 RepID=UPI0007BF4DAE|nr:flavonol sulfotransferase-like [Capsicum annuum]KAF3624134.1 putative deacetylvindoline O-acetyltransferase-like [Capsicum annuum]KAF3644746.1 putative deacetylvindoline O-acetyltransferase-like [Capsicum annuum]